MLDRLNYEAFHAILGAELETCFLEKVGVKSLGALLRALNGFLDGVTPASVNQIVARVQQAKIRQVILATSSLGALAAALRQRCPGVRIITHFQNVETRFFWGAFKQARTLKALGVLLANARAERQAVRNSHALVTLTQRDSQGLQRLFGRGADHIVPLCIPDTWDGNEAATEPAADMLFFGGAFYANLHGLRWFLKHVLPEVPGTLWVAGRGMDAHRQELESSGRVRVWGAVDDINQLYRSCRLVISPIFDGSGMKTKVAEALMHGKRVVSTSEALVGYEAVGTRVGWRADTPQEFARCVRGGLAAPQACFDPALRELYLQFYSLEAGVRYRRALLLSPDEARA